MLLQPDRAPADRGSAPGPQGSTARLEIVVGGSNRNALYLFSDRQLRDCAADIAIANCGPIFRGGIGWMTASAPLKPVKRSVAGRLGTNNSDGRSDDC